MPDFEAVRSAVAVELSSLLARPLARGLYLVATPIGNLGDISVRALSVLARADLLYCEDTRHSRGLLDRYGIKRRLRSLHDHNESGELQTALAELASGKSIAVISDAGTPLISDPGFKLVRAALERDHRVFAIPGASAILAALTSCGLPGDCFTFAGFLPVKAGQRLERLRELAHVAGTLVFFEAPTRLAATLSALAEVFRDACPAAVARELTKQYEEMQRGALGDLKAWAAASRIRGEIVVAVAPGRDLDRIASDEEIIAALAGEPASSLRDSVDAVAAGLRTSRKRVYDLALRSRKD